MTTYRPFGGGQLFEELTMPAHHWMTYRERARLWRGFDEMTELLEELARLDESGIAEQLATLEEFEFDSVDQLIEHVHGLRETLDDRDEALRMVSTYDARIGDIIDQYLASPDTVNIGELMDALE